jgi:hypothetical protein
LKGPHEMTGHVTIEATRIRTPLACSQLALLRISQSARRAERRCFARFYRQRPRDEFKSACLRFATVCLELGRANGRLGARARWKRAQSGGGYWYLHDRARMRNSPIVACFLVNRTGHDYDQSY